MKRFIALLFATSLVAAACSSEQTGDTAATTGASAQSESTEALVTDDEADGQDQADLTGESSTYQIEVWADNWMAVYVNGDLVGEDSVPITTERSFNSETFTFETSTPFTVAIEAKDFKETDSGIEYIGEQNQQMGDGGIIAQITDLTTGEVVAVTDSDWASLVVHQAPLNTECEKDPDPDATCEFLIVDTPTDWTSVDFDDSTWTSATEWTAGEVGTKDGYDEISWDATAQLIWGTDLEVDNTILLRRTVS